VVEVIKLLLNNIGALDYFLILHRFRHIMAVAAQRQREIVGQWEMKIVRESRKMSGLGTVVVCEFGDELIMGRRNRMKTISLETS
jgi:hypothetical protein